MDELKIPKDRIAVLVGKNGAVKRRIERLTKTSLTINSREGDVIIEGDSLSVYIAKLIVQAIARGFNPKTAEILTDDSYMFEQIEIKSYAKTKKRLRVLKGRVIGTKGRVWKMVESITSTSISVYGKTIGIIGRIEDVALAKEAIEYILEGAPHGKVYKFLHDKKRKIALANAAGYGDKEEKDNIVS